MQNIQEKAEELYGHAVDYSKTLYELGVIKMTEKAVTSVANTVSGFAIVFFLFLIFLIGGIGVGWWIGEAIGNMAAGFLIIASFYLVCLLLFILLRKQIFFPVIRNTLIKKIYE